jgi:NAD(P)-dependent dehydrogenase (short-subunit alcohol dehydrogenase family)
MDELDGKVAVVTGAASGIGFALTRAFLDAGCRVVLADVEDGALGATHEELAADGLGERVHAIRTDVADRGSVEKLAAGSVERFGSVDVLCNNAGVSTFNTLEHQTTSDWEWVLGVDLWGVIHGVQTFLPLMRAQGTPAHVVNTASLAGLLSGVAYLGPYAVAKAGVVSLSETMRRELAEEGVPIGVSVLCPGLTETNVMESERNRPAVHGVEQRTEAGEGWRVGMRSGFGTPGSLSPRAVADQVVDAVRSDRFWVVSHQGFASTLEERFAEILEAAGPP